MSDKKDQEKKVETDETANVFAQDHIIIKFKDTDEVILQKRG